MQETKILGQRGEAAALKYLIKNNYQIIATNYKSGYQEIDIISKKNENFIFLISRERIKIFQKFQRI